MKKIFLWAYLMFLITCLVACGNLSGTNTTECTHTWDKLNCSLPRQCTICGAFDSTKRTHFYSTYGTCLQQAKCYYCGEPGPYGDHKFLGADCVAKCTYCECNGPNFGKHQFTGGTCLEKKVCSSCGSEGEEFGEHQFVGNCTALRVCTICGCDDIEFGAHSFSEPTCTEEGVCAFCEKTIPTIAHDLIPASCTAPISCSQCDYTEGEALGHDGTMKCSRCNQYIPITGSGYGDAVISDIRLDSSSICVLHIKHSGRRNFIVHSYDADGYEELLVNEIGNYDGTVWLLAVSPIMLNIQADGAWEYEVKALGATLEHSFSGKGDSVSEIFGGMSGSHAWRFKHDGNSNFIVKVFSSNGIDLIVNEIGPYDAAQVVKLPDNGAAFFIISADGNWEIYPE